MTHVVELPEETYQKLQRVAEEEGVTPAEWITATVSRAGTQVPVNGKESPRHALADYIGAFDSSEVKPDERFRSDFGDVVDAKFARQGITPPRWER